MVVEEEDEAQEKIAASFEGTFEEGALELSIISRGASEVSDSSEFRLLWLLAADCPEIGWQVLLFGLKGELAEEDEEGELLIEDPYMSKGKGQKW